MNPALAKTVCVVCRNPQAMGDVGEHANANLPLGIVSKNATIKTIPFGPHGTWVVV